MERSTKTGRKIIAEFKSSMGEAKIDIQVGKLDKRGESKRLISNVVPQKTVKAGEEVHLRIAYKRPAGNYLVYIHSKGWAIVDNLQETFKVKKEKDLDLLVYKDFNSLDTMDKAKLLIENIREEELTKTDKMLIAHLKGQDLNEVEKEVNCDKSLKYKIRKNTEDFAKKFVNKFTAMEIPVTA